ncbi:hypothetical protein RGQ29_026546 [Quercus rubra]|uniref:Uncharacterized protein n=1 Tax=Quercus rubra TaxID=3512 RepID=A0AAN7ENH2_QUERU|nr:hypothetical protein RGQ29_026546 [Quercus rubra]
MEDQSAHTTFRKLQSGFKCQCFKDFQVLNQPEHQ